MHLPIRRSYARYGRAPDAPANKEELRQITPRELSTTREPETVWRIPPCSRTLAHISVSVVLGGPQLPTARPVAPTLSDIEIFLWSPSRVQIAGVLAILDWAIWLCWGYVLATTVLRILVLVAERVAIGAAWVRSFRWVSDQIDAPKEMQSAWPKHSR